MKKKIIPIILIVSFSIVLWGSVSLSDYYVETISVPIELTELPKNYSPSYISNKEILLKLKAKGWELAKLILTRDFSFYISAHRRIGRFRVDLRNEIENNMWLTSSFSVLEIIPSFIEYEIDKTVSKKVPIKNNITIKLADGYGFVSDVMLNPDKIEISGPASILQYIDSVETDFTNLTDINEKTVKEVNLKPIDGVSFSVDKCSIEFDVQKIVEKSFEDIPVEIRNVPSSKELNLFPSKISVVLRGGINKLGRLTNDSIKVYVDFWSVLRNEEEMIEPVIEIPPFTKLLDVKPKKLEYIIKQY